MKRHVLLTGCVGVSCLGVGLLANRASAGGKSKGPIPTAWSHLYVRAIDCEKTFDFYHRVLGMAFVGAKPSGEKTYYYFQSGGVRICAGGYPARPSDYRPKRMSILSLHLEVADISAMYERIRSFGYDNVTEPRTAAWGARTFTVYDPNGIAIGMTEWVGKSDWQMHRQLDHSDPFPK